VPAQNKPKKEELENCFGFIDQEFKVLKNIKVIICLGKIAFDICCSLLQIETPRFSHGRVFYNKNRFIISSYHPSRQNTQTGRLRWDDWNNVFIKAKTFLENH